MLLVLRRISNTRQANCSYPCIFQHMSTGRRGPGPKRKLNVKRFDTVNPVTNKRQGSLFNDGSTDNVYTERFEGPDSNFSSADKMYNSYEREMSDLSEQKQLRIVKQKYFKPPIQPNFLTWAEKEQIRYLHNSDPQEWSSEKLSQSFPASEIIINKIIKAKWDASDITEISRHDRSVDKNWKALFAGNLEIDSDLKTHLLKFAKREQATLAHSFMAQTESIRRTDTLPGGKSGEFSSIIESYNDILSSSKEPLLPLTSRPVETREAQGHARSTRNCDTYVLDDGEPKKIIKHFTLEQYKQDFNFNPTNQEDRIAQFKSDNALLENDTKEVMPNITRQSNRKPLVLQEKSNFHEYPESISIPKDKWKEGGTFKKGDCYYDDDGDFLYRVPGMK